MNNIPVTALRKGDIIITDNDGKARMIRTIGPGPGPGTLTQIAFDNGQVLLCQPRSCFTLIGHRPQEQAINSESLKAHFRRCGATYAKVTGDLIVTSWKDPALAAKCADTMRRAGLRNVKSYPNPDHKTTVEGSI